MAVKLPDTLVPMADFPSAFAKDVQFTDGENLQDKLDKGKLGSSSGGTGLTEEQANNIEKIPSIEGIVTSNSQAIENKADKDHEHTEYLKEIPDEYVTDTELSSKGYATETFVTSKIAEASLSGGDVDLSGYATKDDIPTKTSELTNDSGFITTIPDIYALKTDIPTMPTKTSQLTNDSGFVTSIPSEYITETELEAKGYLTEHQSLTDYAKKTDIPDVSDFLTEVPAEYVTDTELSTELDKKVDKEVGKGLSTNDLTNELVTKINSSATEAFVTNAIANAQLGGKEVDLSGYATVDALNLKADLTHTHDQYLTEVPDEYITETELTDKNYADKTYVTQAVSNVKVDLTGYAKTSDIPTKVSQLTNDKEYLSSVPSEYVTEEKLNAKGYLTEHQDISNLALKSEIPDVSSFITSDDLPTVPTKTSQLTNDSNFITSIPEEYITETELANELSTRNVKTYTNITQLGLSAPVITGKIYNALPENSIFQCEITDNKTVSDTPEATGILTIQKSSKRLAIEFKACARYSVYPNNLYLGQLKGDDGSGITWNKVALSSDLEGITGGGGIAPNITIGTVSSGTEASASITGATPNLVLNLTIPKGDKGDTGANGKDGTFDATTLFSSLETTDKTVIGAINEVKDKADLILDTEVRLDKTYSSSKIYTDIRQCLEDSKTYTLEELGKKIGASYKVVASTDDMVSQNYLYLLKNGNNYDIYIVDVDNVPVAIGDTSIDLNGYVTKTEIESELGTERLGTTSQTVKGAINELKTNISNINTGGGSSFSGSYNDLTDKPTIPTKTSDLTNDSGFITSIPSGYITETDIDQTIIDTYGTEILKYPLGRWRITSDNVSISNKFLDLPVKTCGRIEITSVDADRNKNPWNNSWSCRVYNFETYSGMNYFRKLSSAGTASVIKLDTGWQKVCITKVEDVGVTTIKPVDSNITGNIEYTIKNGICYVSMKDLMSTVSSTKLLISSTMPKPSIDCATLSVDSGGSITRIYIDKNTKNLYGNFYTKNAKSRCSFSYPVAE